MPHLPTPNMKTLPLIQLDDKCGKCAKLKARLKAYEKGKKYVMYLGKRYTLTEFRNDCRCCKTGNGGMYKGDAIEQLAIKNLLLQQALDALSKAEKEIELFKQNRNVGKKKTRFKTHGKTVCNLRGEGKSLKQISDTTGLAINTIRDILKESENNE